MRQLPSQSPAESRHTHARTPPNAVDTAAIQDGAVTSPKLATDAVVAGKIAAGAVSQSSDFAAGVVDSTALGTDAVTAGKIADAAIDALALFTTNLFNLSIARAVPSAARSTTSATYVDWPAAEALSMSYTKAIAASRLLVLFAGTGFGTVANALAQFAIQVDSGSDTEISRWFGNTLNSHLTFVGFREITGIGAGARTIKLRAHTDGVMTLNADASDFNVLAVLELP